MDHQDEQSTGQLGIKDVASLLRVSAESLSSPKRQLGTLVELIEALMEKHGENWVMQHSGVILDQWEAMLSPGISGNAGQEPQAS